MVYICRVCVSVVQCHSVMHVECSVNRILWSQHSAPQVFYSSCHHECLSAIVLWRFMEKQWSYGGLSWGIKSRPVVRQLSSSRFHHVRYLWPSWHSLLHLVHGAHAPQSLRSPSRTARCSLFRWWHRRKSQLVFCPLVKINASHHQFNVTKISGSPNCTYTLSVTDGSVQDVDGNVVLVKNPDVPQEWVITKAEGDDMYTWVKPLAPLRIKQDSDAMCLVLSRRALPLRGLIPMAHLGASVR